MTQHSDACKVMHSHETALLRLQGTAQSKTGSQTQGNQSMMMRVMQGYKHTHIVSRKVAYNMFCSTRASGISLGKFAPAYCCMPA